MAVCRLSLVVVSRSDTLAAVHRLLTVERGSRGSWAPAVMAHSLSCLPTCGIFLDQGLNLCPVHWQVDS